MVYVYSRHFVILQSLKVFLPPKCLDSDCHFLSNYVPYSTWHAKLSKFKPVTYTFWYTHCTNKFENSFPGILVWDLMEIKVFFNFLCQIVFLWSIKDSLSCSPCLWSVKNAVVNTNRQQSTKILFFKLVCVFGLFLTYKEFSKLFDISYRTPSF